MPDLPKTLRRTLSVLIAITVTTLGVYGAVRVGAVIFPSSSVIASAGNQVQTCPATGCTAYSCHGATGAPPLGQDGSTSQSSTTPDQGGGSASTVTQVCPATGCTATSCHGATGEPPPSSQNGNATQQSGVTPDQGGGSGSTVTYVCPRTGCAATSCHGATGEPPPSRSGHRRRSSSNDD